MRGNSHVGFLGEGLTVMAAFFVKGSDNPPI